MFGDDEDMVGLDLQSLRDQFRRHCSVLRENLVERCRDAPHVIDSDDGHTSLLTLLCLVFSMAHLRRFSSIRS